MRTVIRKPLPGRIASTVFALLATGLAVLSLLGAIAQGDPVIALGGPGFGVAAYFTYRQGWVAVEIWPDELVIRNRVRTARLGRADVVRFRGSGPGLGWIEVLGPSDRIMVLSATARQTVTRAGRERHDQWLAQLNAWLAEAPAQ